MTQQVPDKQPKKIAVIGNGKQVIVNPAVKLAPCPNCNGRKCCLCKFQGVYRE